MYTNPFPGPVTLANGAVIMDPAGTPASGDDCLPLIEGGGGPENESARYWCAFWGRSGNRPKAMTAVMPSMTNTALVTTLSPKPDFGPQDLVKPMPSIVNTAPVGEPVPVCDGFTAWVAGNPLLAAGLLAGAAWLVFKGK